MNEAQQPDTINAPDCTYTPRGLRIARASAAIFLASGAAETIGDRAMLLDLSLYQCALFRDAEIERGRRARKNEHLDDDPYISR